MTDNNICDCGWSEHGKNVNPNRQKCPECGAPFFSREETRWFMHTSESLSAKTEEIDGGTDE